MGGGTGSGQSGLAHSLTLSEPLRLRPVSERRFALRVPRPIVSSWRSRKFLIASPTSSFPAVNVGANLADDVTYSGTVAGAIEGTLQGIRSIALSQAFNMPLAATFPGM